jgi:hypothetical protein
VTAQYETLRAAALGEQLPVEARGGLALLLRRGMWAWAQAAAAATAMPRPMKSPLPSSITDDSRQAVVHLFAALAVNSAEKTNERLA